MVKPLTLPATVLVVALSLTGCAGDGSDSSSSGSAATTPAEASPSASRSAQPAPGTSIDITIKNGTVSPSGERVQAEVDEPVTLHIDADTAGELHVHSTPEQEIEFSKGVSTKQLTIDKPGIVDVEDHALEQVIVQLQVS